MTLQYLVEALDQLRVGWIGGMLVYFALSLSCPDFGFELTLFLTEVRLPFSPRYILDFLQLLLLYVDVLLDSLGRSLGIL